MRKEFYLFLARCCYSQKEELRTRTSDNKRSRSHSERFSFAKSLCVLSLRACGSLRPAKRARTIFVVFVGEKIVLFTQTAKHPHESLKVR